MSINKGGGGLDIIFISKKKKIIFPFFSFRQSFFFFGFLAKIYDKDVMILKCLRKGIRPKVNKFTGLYKRVWPYLVGYRRLTSAVRGSLGRFLF